MIYMRMFANTKNQQKTLHRVWESVLENYQHHYAFTPLYYLLEFTRSFQVWWKGPHWKEYTTQIRSTHDDMSVFFFQFRLYFGGHVIHKQKTSGEIFIIEGDKYHFLILCGLKNLIVDEATKTDTFFDKSLRNMNFFGLIFWFFR